MQFLHFCTRLDQRTRAGAGLARHAYAVTMTGTGAPWTLAELESVMDELSEHYDEWHLAGIGGSISDDGVPKGSAWVEQGAEPDPRLLAWIARLDHPDMIELREVGVSLPGEGPWIDTHEDMRASGYSRCGSGPWSRARLERSCWRPGVASVTV